MKFLELLSHVGLIAAHRGARSIAPENTLAALKKSVGRCDFIEIDVQLSRDGEAIVMHDDTLQRTTDVAQIASFASRKPYYVSDFTLSELKKLDYGSWFYKDKKHSEPLLTLKDALLFIKENSILLNIEIKDMNKKFNNADVVGVVVDAIRKSGVMDSVLISSFRHEYLKIIKAELSDVPTAALVEGKHPPRLLEYLRELKVEGYSLNNELVDRESVETLREAGFFVGVYTVNNSKRVKELFDMGVNCVFSDSLEKKEAGIL
ncbi:MAG: glycerophosphodiester phosphodiesterase family protein [Sulfurimonas sp.]|uniref:glycerophosphodiester phosphodiesterase n=1 Tax=Sulfurimonas sp. TaxID=2022749 RepID=UPI002613F0F2|nr:glycerophosphodiester phosphodiesterase family protein [Sulfurimonas sp.]MDD2652298.1 glycerophosphodiester phosphodiesterase family protein [Sulfurimonas sp.]MDD3451533.1 glycerophosphodiester phosphodiesterase family protein [Sulfurimonas sp.]